MHIRKQRLLTPGPTPLYPTALHAMMASDCRQWPGPEVRAQAHEVLAKSDAEARVTENHPTRRERTGW
jgi:aspartate aminotransferase-like enzyme